MNKKRLLWLRRQFEKKHGRPPKKTMYDIHGNMYPSEWRQVKRHWLRTKEVL